MFEEALRTRGFCRFRDPPESPVIAHGSFPWHSSRRCSGSSVRACPCPAPGFAGRTAHERAAREPARVPGLARTARPAPLSRCPTRPQDHRHIPRDARAHRPAPRASSRHRARAAGHGSVEAAPTLTILASPADHRPVGTALGAVAVVPPAVEPASRLRVSLLGSFSIDRPEGTVRGVFVANSEPVHRGGLRRRIYGRHVGLGIKLAPSAIDDQPLVD
jgi:hypothetical protein